MCTHMQAKGQESTKEKSQRESENLRLKEHPNWLLP